MSKVCGDFDLANEAVGTEYRRKLGLQHLDRDWAMVLAVVGKVHGRHPAAAELALDRVPPGEGGADFGEHVRHGGARARGTLDDMSQGRTGPEAEPFAPFGSASRNFAYLVVPPSPYRPVMLARVRSGAVLGIDAYLVDVETDIANGLPTFCCEIRIE